MVLITCAVFDVFCVIGQFVVLPPGVTVGDGSSQWQQAPSGHTQPPFRSAIDKPITTQ